MSQDRLKPPTDKEAYASVNANLQHRLCNFEDWDFNMGQTAKQPTELLPDVDAARFIAGAMAAAAMSDDVHSPSGFHWSSRWSQKFPFPTFWKGNSLEEDGRRTSRFQGESLLNQNGSRSNITWKCLQESCTAHGFRPLHVEVSSLQESTAFEVFFWMLMKAMKMDEAAAMKGSLQTLKALVLTSS